MLTGFVSYSVRHQAGRFLWAFTHCSVSILGGGPGLYAGPWLRIRRSPAYFPVGFLPSKEPPVTGFRLPGFIIASRASFRRQEIRSPPDRSRVAYGVTALDIALWAPWERAAAVAIFSPGDKTLRLQNPTVNLKPPPKYFVKLQCVTTQELKGLDGQFPFPLRALSGRQSAPHPIWI